jgi:uncharacterized protein (TIGR03083 family)
MPSDYLTSIRRDATTLADVARKAPRDTPISGCPGWDLDDLVVHLGRIHRWVVAAVDAGGENPGKFPPGPDDAADYPDWLAEGAEIMCQKLAALDPAATVWNFSGNKLTAAFWARRQALETAVHRWDGEEAAGPAGAIGAELAVDGIDEIFDVFAPLRRAGKEPLQLGGSLHLHATDADGEWTIAAPDGELVVERGHAKGDVAVRGPASTLYLMLWRRVPPNHPDLARFGDDTLLDRWLAAGVP